jgi:DNA-binding NarL/FixJ family response regulator
VLIVDDIPSTRDNLTKLLSFEPDVRVVGTAADGREAIDEVQKLSPDMVLMGVSMPFLDGIETTRLLLQVMPKLEIILWSVQRDYRSAALMAGASEFLLIPFSGDELVQAIGLVHRSRHAVYEILPHPARPEPQSMPGNSWTTYRPAQDLSIHALTGLGRALADPPQAIDQYWCHSCRRFVSWYGTRWHVVAERLLSFCMACLYDPDFNPSTDLKCHHCSDARRPRSRG